MEEIDKWLGVFGLKLVNAMAAAVVSFAALRFFEGLTTRDKWMTFMGGWAAAAWGSPALREYLELKPGVEVGFVLVIGLFGMALAAEIVKLVRDTDWKGLVAALFRKKTGS